MNKSNWYWLVAVATAMLAVPACVTAEAPAAETAAPGPQPDFSPEQTVSYPEDFAVTVFVDEGMDPPTVHVDRDELVVRKKRGSGPVGIRWILHRDNRPDWSLAAIEWMPEKGEGDGNQQFEPDLNAPGLGVVIHLIDRFTDEEPRSYAYRVWVARKGGMGAPIFLDPTVRNEPEF